MMKKIGIRIVLAGWLVWILTWFAYGQMVNAAIAGHSSRLPAGETMTRPVVVDALRSLSYQLFSGATQFSLIAPILITLGALLIYRGKEGDKSEPPSPGDVATRAAPEK
jgi:hypothetical protein